MSVIIAKIQNKSILNTVKQILSVFTKDISVMNNEEYRDSKLSELLDEGRKSRIVSPIKSESWCKKNL
ncbi:MAG: hypothetical protein A3H98_14475 [Bacteroidetes bacterium RIFCSPLOWO2_02_FULL_36_8]|nr:MAG: hypothetical protein A3H98_14475 [Bacteroidetes bacterium RIFCSPLOWO2_02_FULL_36_8]OFY71843.1 MAG: hypothetical protein A3G23_04770 [Bacteroidetes bacterium RIFCSPLOWO2_12_FULL_37_12]